LDAKEGGYKNRYYYHGPRMFGREIHESFFHSACLSKMELKLYDGLDRDLGQMIHNIPKYF
jgi:hypothetical protein